jgi:hypothetical protein
MAIMTCMRYLALVKYDKENGIKDYRNILVFMAQKNCKHKEEL